MIQVPGYLIKREVGVGGMAMVYLAVQTSLEREVALKVMNPAMVSDPSFSRRFMQEARTLASLAHPNIVAVYDVGITEEKLHYFSMQHLPNGDFLKRIRNGAPEAEILRVLAGVARALGYAHQRGFVHRDVAPGNVLFDINDNPVLTDFGIARAVTKSSRITNAGVSVGTSHYMSPEQARGSDVDGRSDVYSLGALTFEAITGSPPYDGEDGFAIAYAHVFEPVPRLPDNKQHWQTLIDRAMAKDPADRFQNTDEFLAELTHIQSRIGGAGAAAKPTPVEPPTQPMTALPTLRGAAIAQSAPTPPPKSKPAVLIMPGAATEALSADALAAAQKETQRNLRPPPALIAAAVATGATSATVPPKPTSDATPSTVQKSRLPWIIAALVVLGVVLVGAGIWQQHRSAAALAPAATVAEGNPTPTVESPPSAPSPLATIADAADAADADADAPAEPLGVGADDAILDPEQEAQRRLAIETTVIDPVAALLRWGRADIAAQRLSQPAGRNATERFRLALKIEPNNAEAKLGLVNTGRAYAAIAEQQLANGNIAAWMENSARAINTAGSFDSDGDLSSHYEQQRTALLTQALNEGARAIAAWNEADAKAAFERALVLAPSHPAALAGLKQAGGIGKPGYVFSDPVGNQPGPSLRIINSGGKRLAVAETETTVAAFGRFWTAAGASGRSKRPACRDRESSFRSSRSRSWQSPGFEQSGDHPVVCVDWGDAKAYADWLSKSTGKRYRLLSAAEWSALAKTAADGADCTANIGDQSFDQKFHDRSSLNCNDSHATTAPVRRFGATAGFYGIAGNVREWVAGCASGCRKHTVMGSSWASTTGELLPSQHDNFDGESGFNTVGFRVAREID